MTNQEPNDKFIKIDEVVKYVGIGKTKVLELSKSGKFVKPIKIDGFATNLFSFMEVQEWMALQLKNRDKRQG